MSLSNPESLKFAFFSNFWKPKIELPRIIFLWISHSFLSPHQNPGDRGRQESWEGERRREGDNPEKLFWRVKILVFRDLKILQVSWSWEQSKRSYYQIFFDGTFLHEIQKLRFLKLFETFGFFWIPSRKVPSKKIWVIRCLSQARKVPK